MKKYQYLLEAWYQGYDDSFEVWLHNKGQLGWELVQLFENPSKSKLVPCVFKREIET